MYKMYTIASLRLGARNAACVRSSSTLGKLNVNAVGRVAPAAPGSARRYHDESFGFRKRKEYVFPDYTPAQLTNRSENAALLRYVDSMRTHGHRAARIDPLDLIERDEVAALDPTRYGLTDPEKRYNIDGILWTKPVDGRAAAKTAEGEEWWTLREIEKHLREVYVGRIAHEYMHSNSKTERLWFSHLLESESLPSASDVKPLSQFEHAQKKRIHSLLASSEVFDNFLQAKFPNLKRYGLEGGESMIPALDALFSTAAAAGVEQTIVGMPHRGRLNLLTGLLQYAPRSMFHKIKGGSELPEEYGAEGDVLSHLFGSPILQYEQKDIKVSLLPNPSHLEAVNPVVLGKTRAKQFSLLKTSPNDCTLGDKVMSVQLHGDASFIGQGVVMEGLGLSNLPHFTSGGTVHIVVDNNIGYTTPASLARSSLYCSDIGKMINAPVLHVNGDHPEDVVRAMEIAFRYRHYFRKDIIVDLLVYRRWGHNELDLPSLTSPLMYDKINARSSVPQLYEQKLLSEGVLTEGQIAEVRSRWEGFLESELKDTTSYMPTATAAEGQWKGIVWPANEKADYSPDTGVEIDTLKHVGEASVKTPEGFTIHPKLQRHVKKRLQNIDSGTGIDWATAEALAFGSLMREGVDVRISGQDVGRGTFSHRHAMLVDQKTEGVIVPLNDQLKAEGMLELANSSLSEMAVLGFEYGTSWERPNYLPIWEAQFGDFFNGAQVIIDTYVSSAESKWLKQSALVMSLPHGLDGAGPEHSSSRIERFLQLTNDPYEYEGRPSNVNMHVAFPTAPAQYFHLLRRQIKRNFRKPLVVASPKGLLRLAAASSDLAHMEPGTTFQPVLEDSSITHPAQVQRVCLLSGKLYYELAKERADRVASGQQSDLANRVTFVRIEEIAPFPFQELGAVLEQYPNADEFFWVQEEPRNQGCYSHVQARIGEVFKELGVGRDKELTYVGRRESALPAPGIGKMYKEQQKAVLDKAFEGL